MKKPIIAIDVDDVLADSTESLRLAVNRHLGIDLQPEHYKIPGDGYHGYYAKVWADHGLSLTMDELGPQMVEDQSHVQPHQGARETLAELRRHYRLVVVTGRQISWKPATLRWLDMYFPGVFSAVAFTTDTEDEPKTKGQLCTELGAGWLIEDNVEHAESALAEGIRVILFGEYGWHHKVPKQVVRCKDWAAVKEYFDARTD